MDCYIGVDLGSTTTKAVYMDDKEQILGRGITNSRSNYELACEIAAEEAAINARMNLLGVRLHDELGTKNGVQGLTECIANKFRYAQHLDQVDALETMCNTVVDAWPESGLKTACAEALPAIFAYMREAAEPLFDGDAVAKSDFFRDIASSQYLECAEELSRDGGVSFDRLTSVFDKAILLVEGQSFSDNCRPYFDRACEATVAKEAYGAYAAAVRAASQYASELQFHVINTIGTGYGRQTLPFPQHQIRSEILCHGLGAHFMFPNSRTVLDIGGQDTKAIQVDEQGIVTSFQMNDRCAAGCGRYLGYIADEMSMGVHELGPMALQSRKAVKINSTCTVFAGAELRERLALGERREDILAGLHRAIILRAMSLLARSGGVRDEFTFTGGVAKNRAATQSLEGLVHAHYGDLTLNISPDSIYTGAIGAALFSKSRNDIKVANIDVTALRQRRRKTKG